MPAIYTTGFARAFEQLAEVAVVDGFDPCMISAVPQGSVANLRGRRRDGFGLDGASACRTSGDVTSRVRSCSGRSGGIVVTA